MLDACTNCIFFLSADSTCHCYAPQPGVSVGAFHWPKVEPTDWCGMGIHKVLGHQYSPPPGRNQ